MSSLREIRRKIKSIGSTLSVTKAMKMVAAAKLQKAQQRILASRPFALRLQELLEDIDAQLNASDTELQEPHPLLEKKESTKELLIVVSADKGLCGGFNQNIFRKAVTYIKDSPDKNIELFVVGKKARDFFRRFGYSVAKEYAHIFARLRYAHAELIGQEIIDHYIAGQFSSVTVLYNSSRNALVQDILMEQLLPVIYKREHHLKTGRLQRIASPENTFLYEPRCDVLLHELLPRYIKAQVYRILLDSYASEMSARMIAMESATKNALELIDFLKLKFNRTRQELITKELTELVSGAEALSMR